MWARITAKGVPGGYTHNPWGWGGGEHVSNISWSEAWDPEERYWYLRLHIHVNLGAFLWSVITISPYSFGHIWKSQDVYLFLQGKNKPNDGIAFLHLFLELAWSQTLPMFCSGSFLSCHPDLIQFLSCSSFVYILFLFCTDFGLFWYCSHCDLTLSSTFYDSVLALFLIFLKFLKFCLQCVLIHANCGQRWPNQILASLVWLVGSSLMALSWST